MRDWKPDPILKAIICWITFILVFSWLPLVRIVFEGDTYQWGTTHFLRVFSAAGWQSDAWLLVFKSVLLFGLLVGAVRGANRLFRLVLVVWSAAMIADVATQFVANPTGFEFHGDTLGIRLNLGWPVIGVTALFSGLAFFWVSRETRRASAPGGSGPRRPPWVDTNARALGALLAAVPVQFLLLRAGEPHGLTDQIGVLLTIASLPLLAWALYPRRDPSRVATG